MIRAQRQKAKAEREQREPPREDATTLADGDSSLEGERVLSVVEATVTDGLELPSIRGTPTVTSRDGVATRYVRGCGLTES